MKLNSKLLLTSVPTPHHIFHREDIIRDETFAEFWTARTYTYPEWARVQVTESQWRLWIYCCSADGHWGTDMSRCQLRGRKPGKGLMYGKLSPHSERYEELMKTPLGEVALYPRNSTLGGKLRFLSRSQHCGYCGEGRLIRPDGKQSRYPLHFTEMLRPSTYKSGKDMDCSSNDCYWGCRDHGNYEEFVEGLDKLVKESSDTLRLPDFTCDSCRSMLREMKSGDSSKWYEKHLIKCVESGFTYKERGSLGRKWMADRLRRSNKLRRTKRMAEAKQEARRKADAANRVRDNRKITLEEYVEKIEKPAGYVYLMKSGCGKYHKIGYSTQPKNRESTLQAEDPLLRLIHYQPGDLKYERILHTRYSASRVRGEWFDLSGDDVHEIMSASDAQKQQIS